MSTRQQLAFLSQRMIGNYFIHVCAAGHMRSFMLTLSGLSKKLHQIGERSKKELSVHHFAFYDGPAATVFAGTPDIAVMPVSATTWIWKAQVFAAKWLCDFWS